MSTLSEQLRAAVDGEVTLDAVDRAYHDNAPADLVNDILGALNPVVNSALDKFDKQGVEIMDLNMECANLQERKRVAYSERNMMVKFLTLLYPAHLKKHPEDDKDWEDDWRNIVCVHSPMGQLTWHIHDSELSMFDHLESDQTCEWDGHTTEEKYRRLLSFKKPKPAEAGISQANGWCGGCGELINDDYSCDCHGDR